MAGHDFTAQEASAQWAIFKQDPATSVANVSFRIYQEAQALGTTHCNVTGIPLKDTQPTNNPKDTITNKYTGRTQIVCLKVQASANVADSYWYPYLAAGANGGTFDGVGEVTIPAAAPNGAIALTNAMNGCSLRVYSNDANNDLKFFHDNNGAYVDHGTMTNAGWTHELSLNVANTDAKKRGADGDNHVYWDNKMGNFSSVALISIKVGGSWEIYLCVSDSNQPIMKLHKRTFGTDSIDYTYNWSNDQGFNQRIAVI